MRSVLIVGSGATGAAAAYALSGAVRAGKLTVSVWDKARGAGGRMNTTRRFVAVPRRGGALSALTGCPQPLRRRSNRGPGGAVPDAAQEGQPAGRRRLRGPRPRRHHCSSALRAARRPRRRRGCRELHGARRHQPRREALSPRSRRCGTHALGARPSSHLPAPPPPGVCAHMHRLWRVDHVPAARRWRPPRGRGRWHRLAGPGGGRSDGALRRGHPDTAGPAAAGAGRRVAGPSGQASSGRVGQSPAVWQLRPRPPLLRPLLLAIRGRTLLPRPAGAGRAGRLGRALRGRRRVPSLCRQGLREAVGGAERRCVQQQRAHVHADSLTPTHAAARAGCSLVLHTSVPYGIRRVDDDSKTVEAEVVEAAQRHFPSLPNAADWCRTIRWRYSQASRPATDSGGTLLLDETGPLLAAGDYLAASNFGGCITSAHAAVDAIERQWGLSLGREACAAPAQGASHL